MQGAMNMAKSKTRKLDPEAVCLSQMLFPGKFDYKKYFSALETLKHEYENKCTVMNCRAIIRIGEIDKRNAKKLNYIG